MLFGIVNKNIHLRFFPASNPGMECGALFLEALTNFCKTLSGYVPGTQRGWF